MYLEKLKLRHFRNYHEQELEFSPHINILIGENAQGKTNLLEAIYVLAMARSHRTANDRELIEFEGKEGAFIEGRVQKHLGSVRLSLALTKQGKKARVNQLEQTRLSQYIGNLNVILFAPEDLALVKGSPAVRRRFVDMEFGQIDAAYLHELTKYRTILKNRNSYLKQLQQKKADDRIYLEVLTAQLVKAGAFILEKRCYFLAQLEQYAAKIQTQISQDKEQLKIEYKTSIHDQIQKLSRTEIEACYTQTFQKYVDKEIFQGTTLIGPHRDDVLFKVNGKNVQIYGSQGQKRTTALAVKLAEIDLMHDQTGEYPVLLLDDVLSELDGKRQTHLLKAIQDKVQTFLTTPALNDVAKKIIKEPKMFYIHKGQIETGDKTKTQIFYPHQK